MKKIAPNVDPSKLKQILSASFALLSEESMNLGLPDFPVDGVIKLGEILKNFPEVEVSDLINRLYPFNSFLNREGCDAVYHIFSTFSISKSTNKNKKNKIEEVKISSDSYTANCLVKYDSSAAQVKVGL